MSALRPIAERRIRTESVVRWLGLLTALASLSVPSRAAAEEPPAAPAAPSPHASLVVTRGEGAEDCPDAASLREQVQRVAGAGVLSAGMSSASANDTWIQVVIVHNFGGYRAEISAGGLHRGRRTLEDLGPGFSSLADAVAITIAIFLDAYATQPAPRATPPKVPAPPKFHAFDFQRPISAWIYAICLRVASDRRRSAAHRHEQLAETAEAPEPVELAVSPNAGEAERARSAERCALLEAALDAMSNEQRAVFTLFELEGHTGEQVAGLLGVPTATVHSRLRLAREVFRRTVERSKARDRFEVRRMGGER